MITRRTFAGLSVSIAIALASAVPALAETTFEKIKRTGTMVVGTEAAYPPFEFVKDGQITGFGRDLLDEIARSWGVEIKQLDLPFQGILPGLLAQKFDFVATSVGINPERAARYAYTLPIADSTAYAIKRAGNDHIKGVEDLAGKVVATQLASAVDPVAKALDEKLKAEGKGFSELKLFPTFNDSFLAVANGTADAAMAGLPVLQNLMNERPGVFELVGQAADTQSLNAWVVRPEDKDLRDAINAVVLELKASGRFAELQQKWLGMTYDLPEKDYLPEGAL
ncbi:MULTISPECIES: transporter substrate-binding domain-containing protein [Paracoccus]|jgi:polar amino acid transport system substrate-binding protein|uniref:Amino acid ABC transporter substrate-binding protein, PAAT family n=1 Tax=Paracoccus denitrificans (strain Pd 1222) TaxID=318586 RepID=A1B161_PARDP|nr:MULTISPECIES: transporter substrate-binding domain-containing protein [Paracoccus]ABL69255.1 amino acid ABC transporter substrate-binding protein, PAAT family [Paracoccus denitrificans PD1222]MBB4629091.1 polar amino acid transport system substrate-binding protein [Paracoccus denitrificans]MCU7430750.1 transporter substrate-binding domain-containing protein [Paracoccus denitrificans]MDK8874603.1 transporter substrate-binding domain-containing protein [Paracoccus sp. SSJ]QAR27262.1 transport